MHFAVREPDGDLPLFLSLQVPGPPASVLCGVMSGVAFVAHESLPSACRIVFIRVPDTPMLNRTNRYFESIPAPSRPTSRISGVNAQEADRLDALTRSFLGTSANQVTPQDYAAFASLLDHAHFDLAG